MAVDPESYFELFTFVLLRPGIRGGGTTWFGFHEGDGAPEALAEAHHRPTCGRTGLAGALCWCSGSLIPPWLFDLTNHWGTCTFFVMKLREIVEYPMHGKSSHCLG